MMCRLWDGVALNNKDQQLWDAVKVPGAAMGFISAPQLER